MANVTDCSSIITENIIGVSNNSGVILSKAEQNKTASKLLSNLVGQFKL